MNDNKIDFYIKAIDNENIEEIKIIKNDITNKNIVNKIYIKGLLTSKRLKFLIKNSNNYIVISSSLIKKLLDDNKVELLDIIFNNFKIFDNEFILKLLYHHKNNIPLLTKELNKLIENYKISTKKDENIWNDSYQSVDVYLINACLSGKIILVKYLNKLGKDINKIYASGKTPLCYACESGNENLINYLIEHGADINKEDEYGITPLFIACKNENINLVRYLIECGVNVNKENRYNVSLLSASTFCGISPLFYACEGRNETIVKYLIEHGADINKKDKCGKTPLFYACFNGKKTIVKYLIDHGADINIKNLFDETPIDYAYKSGNENLVKYLIEHGEVIKKEVKSLKDVNNNNKNTIKNSTFNNKNTIEETVDKYLKNPHNKEIFKSFIDMEMCLLHDEVLTLDEKTQYNELFLFMKNHINMVKKEFYNNTKEADNNIGNFVFELVSKINEYKIDNNEIMERIKIHYDEEELSELGFFNSFSLFLYFVIN